ncbi:AMP-binding protein [Amycolatopsis acidicola]|uniref:AMP-binding protein n=1 Tax=Amycolatopsis acidicola TaxID=2596893 RepID=A0A5N0UT97_9PSEU|nr:AMP-binding protein [Amycolatopsis acidicola]
MLARAHGAARHLAGLGIKPGNRVAIDSPDVLPWFLGTDLLGAAALVVEPAWTPREREAVLADVAPDVVVTGSAPSTTDTVEAAAGPWFYLPTTSGSSGSPKVLLRTRESWLRSFEVLGRFAPGEVLIPGPLSSSLFLFGALHALWTDNSVRLLPKWEPAAAAEACRTATAVHLVPSMLSSLLAVLERHPGSALRTVVCGGAKLDDAVRERFARVLPDAELIEYYGAAEHSLIAIRRGADGLRPVADVEIREGVLWVRSPMVFGGYLRGGEVCPVDDEWSTVDDLAELKDGVLTLFGRAGTVVSSGGKLVSAEEVEGVLRAVPGVSDVVVTGTPHPTLGEVVTAVVETDGVQLQALREQVRAGLEPGKRPHRWYSTKALPRTASGKPARAVLAGQLADGTLERLT